MKLVSGCISPTSSELLILLIIINGDLYKLEKFTTLIIINRERKL